MSLSIGMLGFGAQGKAEARNLKKSGVDFMLGLRPGKSEELAKSEDFDVQSIEKAADQDLLFINLPDHVQADVYREFVEGRGAKYLIFAHGFNTHFGLIPVKASGPKHVLIAPKGAASGLEEFYKTPQALPAILSVRSVVSKGISKEPTQDEKQLFEDLALKLGCNPKGLVWADFRDEAECDLFSEQALLCGGVSSLLRQTYEVMVEAGYNPETAYFETLFELKLIVDLMWKQGITGMRSRISPTARYGDVTRGDRIIDDSVKEKMKEVLAEIQSGKFAKEFLANHEASDYLETQNKQASHPIEKIGKKIREKLFN